MKRSTIAILALCTLAGIVAVWLDPISGALGILVFLGGAGIYWVGLSDWFRSTIKNSSELSDWFEDSCDRSIKRAEDLPKAGQATSDASPELSKFCETIAKDDLDRLLALERDRASFARSGATVEEIERRADRDRRDWEIRITGPPCDHDWDPDPRHFSRTCNNCGRTEVAGATGWEIWAP